MAETICLSTTERLNENLMRVKCLVICILLKLIIRSRDQTNALATRQLLTKFSISSIHTQNKGDSKKKRKTEDTGS